MERLTYRDKKGKAHIFCKQMCTDAGNCTDPYSVDLCQRFSAFRKLAEYEELEEQGRLLRLPCKVGDTVYKITRNFISEYKIISETIYPYSIQFNWQCTKGIYGNLVGFADREIGKTVFLTREEAEAKLKEMEEIHD